MPHKLFVPPRGFIPPPGLIAGKVLSRRQPRNEVQRGILVFGRDARGRVCWSGRFRNDADAEKFIRSSASGELWFDTALWRLPSPQWHPDYGPLVYEFAIALDGHNTGSGTGGVSATLTTTSANDVIVAFVGDKTTGVTVSSMAGTGISWQGTARKALTITGVAEVELWYGTASAALSSVTITPTFSGSAARCTMCVFGISGAQTVSFTDSNASLPATATGSSGATPTVTGVSTSNTNDMIIAGTLDGTGTANTAGAGFTLIDSVSANNGGSQLSDEYEVVSATQSSISVAFGTAAGAAWGMIVDAVKATSVLTLPFGDFDSDLVLDTRMVAYH